MKNIFAAAIFFCSIPFVSAAPFREMSELEKRLASAREECFVNYDKMEAHFKFAGALYDAGCLESAFCNVQSLFHSTLSPESGKLFSLHSRRELRQFFTPEFRSQLEKLPPETRAAKFREALLKAAKSDPEAKNFAAFAADPKRWQSPKPADINQVVRRIISADTSLHKLYHYNISSAHYLYIAAKEYELALPAFIRLYFHNPEFVTQMGTPVGFVIQSIMQRTADLRTNRALIRSRRDPVRLILDYMHTQPRTVENFLRTQRHSMSNDRFVKLCLLATDSVDIQLRSFAFGELLKRDVSVLQVLFKDLYSDHDSGRRAIAVLLLPGAVPPGELPEYLAHLARDRAAIVRMTAETIAKMRCSAEAYARFKALLDRK